MLGTDWMHRTIGSLSPTEPGYRRMQIRPRPGGGLTHAHAKHITPYELAKSKWKIDDGKFDPDIIIPANTSALVTLPNGEQIEVGSGAWHWSVDYQDLDVRGPYTMDDLVGDILIDDAAREAILNAFDSFRTPEFYRAMVFDGRNLTLRDALSMFPNHDDAVKAIQDALADL